MPTLTDPPRFSPSPSDRSDGALAAMSDERLVALLRKGRDGAFDTLMTRYQTRLLWFCWKMLRSKEDAEDALQDVFASALRSLLADDREILVRPWLYRIARNRCINELRRARTVRVQVLDEVRPEHAHTPIESLSRALQFRDLVDDVQALPDTQRTALLLREIDGFAYQEIATAMDTTVPAVKSLLVRARCGLRESRSARDAGPGAAPAGDRGRARARRDCTAASYPAARAAAVALA